MGDKSRRPSAPSMLRAQGQRSAWLDWLSTAGCLALIVCVLGACGAVLLANLLYPSYIERLVSPADYVRSLNPFFNYWPAALALGLILAVVGLISAAWRRAGLVEIAKDCAGGFFAGLLLGAVFLALMTSFGARVNGLLDSSAPQTHSLQVIDKALFRGKFSTSYYFVVSDWRAPNREPVLVFVGLDSPAHDVYKDVPLASTIQVTTHSGYLGLEWVVGVKRE
jgi:cytochrome c biogenesis factor